MSRTVDNRVVEMEFDNRRFERNVATSMSTLDKLKQALNFSGSVKGLNEVNEATRGINMSGLGSAVDSVKVKFSALEIAGITALTRITNSAITTGERLIKSLSVDQIAAGWSKFGSKTSSVATLVAQGNDLKVVNEQLDRLNWFTDETSYNFTDMVSNIAKFTASGKGLEESVTAMEGIANWAALSGQNAQTASHAMYQLSQAMGAGVMRKEDYKSIQNASMDTDEFRQKCLDAGVALGTLKKNADGTYKSLNGGKESFKKSQFAEHLTEDAWFTSDVMMKVFQDYSAAVDQIYDYAEEKGITASQAIEELGDKVDGFGLKAFKAAQEARTWSDAVDSVKDAVSTGWMNTFEIIFGNQQEATKLWTDLANAMYDVFAGGAEARNEMLSEWKDLGGRDALIESFWNTWEAAGKILGSVKEAFRDIFPPTTGKNLAAMTEKLKNFTSNLKISDETANKLKRTFKGVFSIFDMGKKIIGAIGKSIAKLFGSEGVGDLMNSILDGAAKIGDYFTKLNKGFSADGITGVLSTIVSGISDVLKGATGQIKGFENIFSFVGDGIVTIAKKIFSGIQTAIGFISDNFSFADIFAGLAGGGIFVAAKKFSGLIDKIKDIISNIFKKGEDSGSIKSKITGALDALHDSLESFSSGIKISSLVSIAVAVGILTASLRSIAKLDVGDITKSLSAIGIMILMLNQTLKSMSKSLSANPSKGLVKAGASLILVATAVRILASAMEKFASIPLGGLAKGLIAVGVSLPMLTAALKRIDGVNISLKTSVAMIALAESCKILANAVAKFGDMRWGEIAKGLTGMGLALAELVTAMSILNKFGGGKSILGSIGLLIAVQSLSKLADGLKKFGDMEWDAIGRGLVAMGIALAEVGGVIAVVGKITGFKSLFAAGAIFVVVSGLEKLATSLQIFGSMQWGEIGRGLTAMGGALAEVGVVVGLLGKLTGLSGILGAGALLIAIQGLGDLADAMTRFGNMTWDEIARGLVGMGVALVEVGTVTGLLGKLTGLKGILGAGALLLTIRGLGDLADAFKKFGEMSWEEIAQGLVGMGGALTEVSVISGLLGGLGGFAALLGAGTLLVAVQGLGDLADAFKKFGEMSWEEIKNGLAGMGLALTELAAGGLANTFSILGAAAIQDIASSLGTLADGVKKWHDVTVPDGLGDQLGHLADGVLQFTLAGMGAEAISTSAESIGILADSIRKWIGIEIPDGIVDKMSTLADGLKKFTWGGMGADALASSAPAIGTLADSVKKWSGVTVPDGIEDKLTGIANGIKAFSFAFMGGWSLNAVVGPLGELSDSVKKWSNITVPEDIETKLTSIANGVKSFSFAFLGGWSIGSIVEPLSSLADAVRKWSNVTVPENLEDDLTKLSSGVKSFSFAFIGAWSLSTITGPLSDLASAVKKWSGITIPKSIGSDLEDLADGIKSFDDIGDISDSAGSVKTIAESVKKMSGANISGTSKSLSELATAMKKFDSIGDASGSIAKFGESLIKGLIQPISKVATQYTKVGSDIATAIANGFSTHQSVIVNKVKASMTTAISAIKGQNNSFRQGGVGLITSLSSGITSSGSKIKSSIKSAVSNSTSAIRGNYSSFYSAGSYLATGFANGISSGTWKAAAKARAMASAAAEAAKAELKEHSPSKVGFEIGDYFGVGFTNGIGDNIRDAYRVGSDVAQSAKSGLADTVSRISKALDRDIDLNPSIRPVLDLSDIQDNVGALDAMLGSNYSISAMGNVGAISAMMNARSQNGVNGDVISAIDRLRKDLGNINGGTYTINGLSYAEGGDVADAIKTLVRAAKIERRV